jgi:nitroreductase
MEFDAVIRRRESVRAYDPTRPVDKTTLEKILDAGRIAPSAVNFQPWKFLLVSSPQMLSRVRKCYGRPWFSDAPHILVVTGKPSEAWVRKKDGYNSMETDLTIAMDHIILAAENEGVATCWVAAYDPDVLREALGLSADERVCSITPLGYPPAGYERKKDRPRKSLGEVVRFV